MTDIPPTLDPYKNYVNTTVASPVPGSAGYGLSTAGIGTDAPTGPITPESLTPKTPVPLPSTSKSTSSNAGAAITGTASAVNDNTQQLLNDQQTQADKASSAVATDKSGLSALIAKVMGKGDATVAAENAAGIPGLTTSLTDVTNEYNSAKTALQHQVDNIYAQPGVSREQANAQVAEVTRLGNQNLSDIAIRQSVASGNLTAAQGLVDHKIDLQYGDLKDLISYQEDFLKNDQNQLSTAEQNKLQIQLDKNKRDYDYSVTQAKTLEDTKLELLKNAQLNGAPQSVQAAIQKATTPELVISAAGQYGKSLDDIYKQAQIRSLNTKSDTLVSGSAGQYQPIDTSQIQNPNTGNGDWGGLSYNGLLNAASLYNAENGKMPSLGLGQSGDVKKARLAVANYAGQLADALGLTTAQMSAMYKANSTSATQIVNRVAKIDAASNALGNQFPRLAQLAAKVGNLGMTEADVTAGAAAAKSKFGSVDAANYIELLQTVRSDYSAMQSATSGSRGGEFFSRAAAQTIPLGLTPEQYTGLQQTILLSAVNAQKGTQDEANKLIGQIGGGLPSTTTTSTPSSDLSSQFDNLFSQYGGQ